MHINNSKTIMVKCSIYLGKYASERTKVIRIGSENGYKGTKGQKNEQEPDEATNTRGKRRRTIAENTAALVDSATSLIISASVDEVRE